MLALEAKEGFGDQLRKRFGSFLPQRKKVMRGTARMRTAAFDSDSQSSHLRETLNFGSNPEVLQSSRTYRTKFQRSADSLLFFTGELSEYRIDFGGI
jgi:hypothetical protein